MTDLPDDVSDEAERLTHLARDAVDDAEARAYRDERDALLADHDYTARVREDDSRDVLVCHPSEWVEDGTIRPDAIEDTDRGVEIPLSGPGDADEWETVADHNDDLVAAIDDETHRANVRALADFANNHYAKPIEELTRGELQEFRDEYFVRNTWPDEAQRKAVNDSIRLAFDERETACPLE